MDNYGIKYKCKFTSIKGLEYKVYILQRGYNSAVYDLRMGGNPVQINYTSGSENKYEIIRGSECVLNFFSEYDGQFSEIMYADKQDFMVQVFIHEDLHWQGYIINDNYDEPFASAPYLMSLRATDGLGDLKFIDFANENGDVFLTNMTFAEAILNCLAHLKNGTELVTSNDLFEARIDRSVATNEAFNQLTVNPFIFLKNELNAKKCNEVLKMILEIFQCYIYYKKGKYHIERINYKLSETLTRRIYNISFSGTQSIVNTVTTENIRGRIERGGTLSFINNDQHSTFTPAYQKVSAISDTVNPSNLLMNNYFRFWNSTNTAPLSWNKLGNIQIAKEPYLVESDALKIITKANDDQISFSTNMLQAARTVYTGRLSYTNLDELTITLAYKGNVRFMVRANEGTRGNRYLSCVQYINNDTGEITYEAKFESTPVTCKIKNNNVGQSSTANRDWAVATLTVKIPQFAEAIDMAIMPSFNSDNYTGECQIRELTPTIKAGAGQRGNGLTYDIISNKNGSEVYEDFQPQLCEFGYISIVNQLLLNTSMGRLVTLNWYRDGRTESKLLYEIGVRSIMNQYRTPFRLFSGSFFGDFDYSKVYEIETLQGMHMPYKVNSDLKFDTHNAEFFELLDDTDATSDKYEKYINFKDGEYTVNNGLASGNSGSGSGGTPRPRRGGGF